MSLYSIKLLLFKRYFDEYKIRRQEKKKTTHDDVFAFQQLSSRSATDCGSSYNRNFVYGFANFLAIFDRLLIGLTMVLKINIHLNKIKTRHSRQVR
jgi:hypothetical protein